MKKGSCTCLWYVCITLTQCSGHRIQSFSICLSLHEAIFLPLSLSAPLFSFPLKTLFSHFIPVSLTPSFFCLKHGSHHSSFPQLAAQWFTLELILSVSGTVLLFCLLFKKNPNWSTLTLPSSSIFPITSLWHPHPEPYFCGCGLMLVLLLYILGKARLRGNQEEISKLIPTNQKAHKTGLKNKTQSELVSSTCDCWALSSIHDLFGFCG